MIADLFRSDSGHKRSSRRQLLLLSPDVVLGEYVEILSARDFLPLIKSQLIALIVQASDFSDDPGFWKISELCGE